MQKGEHRYQFRLYDGDEKQLETRMMLEELLENSRFNSLSDVSREGIRSLHRDLYGDKTEQNRQQEMTMAIETAIERTVDVISERMTEHDIKMMSLISQGSFAGILARSTINPIAQTVDPVKANIIEKLDTLVEQEAASAKCNVEGSLPESTEKISAGPMDFLKNLNED